MNPNPEYYCKCLTAHSQPGRRAAVLNGVRWQPGSSIRIKFLGGDPALQERVRKVAKEWEQYSGITFDFNNNYSDEEAKIRIAFQPGKGSWSYLGTECENIPAADPTMNYGWLTADSDRTEVRRVVLHEFGHALGLIHEHQNPVGGILWNKAAVKEDLSGPPNEWDDAKIYENMYRHYEPAALTASGVDEFSIMMYPIPATWTIGGVFSAGLNSELTDTDKEIVRRAYNS